MNILKILCKLRYFVGIHSKLQLRHAFQQHPQGEFRLHSQEKTVEKSILRYFIFENNRSLLERKGARSTASKIEGWWNVFGKKFKGIIGLPKKCVCYIAFRGIDLSRNFENIEYFRQRCSLVVFCGISLPNGKLIYWVECLNRKLNVGYTTGLISGSIYY